MPVYNERAAVGAVVQDWFRAVGEVVENFVLLAINDGSTDDSLQVLLHLRERLGPRLEIINRTNQGHGQCCVQGYRAAAERGIPYVFQLDSDGQCDPQYFARFWQMREGQDVIYGRRVRRDDGWRRVVASGVVRAFLLVLFRVNCVDANVPYRLMRSSRLPPFLDRIPPDFSLANIALAVLLRQDQSIRHTDVPILFRKRSGGEPSVRLSHFGRKARDLYLQLRAMLGRPAVRTGLP